MSRFSETEVVVKAAIGAALAVALVMALIWWRVGIDDRAARRTTLPKCIARLGNQNTCEDLLSRNHRECYNFTNRPASRYAPRSFDEAKYLECIIAGPQPWLESERQDRLKRERQDRAEGIPLR